MIPFDVESIMRTTLPCVIALPPQRQRSAMFGALLFASIASPAAAQMERVDAFVRAEMQRQRVPGVSIAIVKDGVIVKARGYGLSNVELAVPASPETVYQSGSVGKQFTATLVMMLVEEGRIGLEDPIGMYVPEAPARWNDITIRHLLTHTSGISDARWDSTDFQRNYSEADLTRMIAAMPLDFAPGSKWKYSNPAYILLGIIVHRVTGKFYGDVLRERIFTPLGMTTARIISEADIVPNRAAGYQLVNGALKNQDWVSPAMNTTADGSLYLTVLDLAKWDAALYGETLLRRASLERMWTPVRLNDGTTHPYGFGWAFGDARGHRIIQHGGAWQGFKSFIARYVDDRVTVIVLMNLGDADPGRFAHGVAGAYGTALTTVP